MARVAFKHKSVSVYDAGYRPVFIQDKKQRKEVISEFLARIPYDMRWEAEINRQLNEERKRNG